MKTKKLIIILMCIINILSLASCSAPLQKASITENCLDTIVTVTCYAKTYDKAYNAAQKAIDEVRRIEFLLSPYIETSEIYRINQNASKSPVKVSEETYYVLTRALNFCKKTNGAFDITVKPLVELWNIKAENPKVPQESELQTALSKVDYNCVVLENGCVRFEKEGMKIDLGGAAKGYGADKVFELLKNEGIKNALIDLGGNIYAMGKSESGSNWKIGLQDPNKARGEHFYVMELSDETCVTSGSYERFFEKDGKIYHHIIDPKTGFPAETNLLSVSVKATSSFEADMLSTAIFVMGWEEFEKHKNNFDYDMYVIVEKGSSADNYKIFERNSHMPTK